MTGFLPENPSALILHISVSIFLFLLARPANQQLLSSQCTLFAFVWLSRLVTCVFPASRGPRIFKLCSVWRKVLGNWVDGYLGIWVSRYPDDELCAPRTLLIIPVPVNKYIVLCRNVCLPRRLTLRMRDMFVWGGSTTRHHLNLLAILLCSNRTQIEGPSTRDTPHHAYAVYYSTAQPLSLITHTPCITSWQLLFAQCTVVQSDARVANLMAGKIQLNQLPGQHTRPAEHV